MSERILIKRAPFWARTRKRFEESRKSAQGSGRYAKRSVTGGEGEGRRGEETQHGGESTRSHFIREHKKTPPLQGTILHKGWKALVVDKSGKITIC